jgi:hypothetical protein
MKTATWAKRPQQGVVAIIVALSLVVLIGFTGLVIDLGRLYVNKSELQSAADACALAAAAELVCDTNSTAICPRAFLQNAESAGIYVAGRNKNNFQSGAVSIAANDVRFHTTLSATTPLNQDVNYLPSSTADTRSKFAMCTARATGIVPWFMNALNLLGMTVGTQSVTASSVATLAPGQTICNSVPIGVCAKSASSPWGYTVGQWITSQFTTGGGPNADDATITGDFRWVDFTPSAGGTNEVRDQIVGNGDACGIRVGDDVQEQGQKQGVKSAWNTRFGLYPNGSSSYDKTTAPPDKTGYSYPSTTIPINTSAYNDYVTHQGNHDLFNSAQYGLTGPAGNFQGKWLTSTDDYRDYGKDRRLIPVPVINCSSAGTNTPILGNACVLLLNPMSNGATGNLYIEWRGLANQAGAACHSAGLPGAGGTGSGSLIPTLVQ